MLVKFLPIFVSDTKICGYNFVAPLTEAIFLVITENLRSSSMFFKNLLHYNKSNPSMEPLKCF